MTKNQVSQQLKKAEVFERPDPLPLRPEGTSPQPYPFKCFGKILADAAEAIVDLVQCPDAIAAQSVLACAALAAQAHVDVMHPASGKARPISLFMVTVAGSGERKSAADSFALEPISVREFDLRDAHETNTRAYKDAKAVYEREREGIIKSIKFDRNEKAKRLVQLGKEPTPPLLPVLTAPDPTLEGLQKLMAAGEPSLGLFNDEGGTFIGGHSMTDEVRLKTGAGLSSLWDGGAVKRVRSGDGVLIAIGRRLSLHLMVQPGVADDLLADAVLQQQGLLSRMLVCAPASNAGLRKHRVQKPGSAAALKRYEKRLLQLLRRPQPRKAPDDPTLSPRPLYLSKGALPLWIEFYNECESELAAGQRLEPVRAFANKLAEHALRIAAVLEFVENTDVVEISADVFGRAVVLARFYADEALRLVEQGAVSIAIQRASLMLKWLHKEGKPKVGMGHVLQCGPPSLRQVALARPVMQLLADYHYVLPIPDGAKIEDKQHREAWEVIPPKTKA